MDSVGDKLAERDWPMACMSITATLSIWITKKKLMQLDYGMNHLKVNNYLLCSPKAFVLTDKS